MRKRPNQDVIEARVVKRFNRLHEPLLNLVQALQDMAPEGAVLGDKVEFTKLDGHLRIGYGQKPIQIVINDGSYVLEMTIRQLDKN